MLKLSCSFRCVFVATRTLLTRKAPPSSRPLPGSDLPGSASGAVSSSAELERAKAVERLSNEVFSRGNVHLKNVETLTALPEGLHSFPEVCFIGKPNCGKSSLIACLLHNARLGKAGAVGGSTRLLQFFNVGDGLLLVDTPGYGGWKGRKLDQSLASRANAFSILFRYLALRKTSNLKRVYWLMEASARGPMSFQARDEELLAFLARERIPFSVVLTKIDRHWRMHAEQQRKTAMIGKDGIVRPARVAQQDDAHHSPPLPTEGITRNMHEVFRFLGTDQIPILAVSPNRKQPARSLNIELLQHDIVHYCTQDLADGEALTFANLHKLSYAPPSADAIQEIQLRYPVEAFVVPEQNNVSLAQMVEQHEEMKARFLANNVSAAQLSAKDAAACHLVSLKEATATLEEEAAHRAQLRSVIPATTFLFDVPPRPPATDLHALEGPTPPLDHVAVEAADIVSAGEGRSWQGCVPPQATKGVAGAAGAVARTFSARPRLAGGDSSPQRGYSDWTSIADASLEGEHRGSQGSLDHMGCGDSEKEECAAVSAQSGAGCSPVVGGDAALEALQAAHAASGGGAGGRGLVLRERTPTAPALPAMIDPNTQYVVAIDGTPIPRSLISVSVEQLAVGKEDELTHFATKSGAGAYEELLLIDHEGGAAAETFTEASDFARLPDAVQDACSAARHNRKHSAALKQEKRFLAKYVEKRRKERSLSMHAQGYMCPWLGVSEGRQVVRGLDGGTALGRSGAVLRGLKQKGFGGRSYSARTMKNRGRATKKTGSWAA